MPPVFGLTADDKQKLAAWIGRQVSEFRLLYKASERGCSASLFHQLCDNKGPTVSLAYTNNDGLFGGYTDKDFTSTANSVETSGNMVRYVDVGWNAVEMSDNIFMFCLREAGVSNYRRHSAANTGILSEATFGPTFVTVEGAGRGKLIRPTIQLRLFSGGPHSRNANGVFEWPGFSSRCTLFDRKLNDDQRGDWWHGYAPSKFVDFEVYQVIIADCLQTTEKPWRTVTTGWTQEAKAQLKREICAYSPPQCVEVPEVQILLLGQIGAGKSSFSNSINSVFLGYPIYMAHAGNDVHSVTSRYRMYSIRDDQEVKLKLHICDTMGLEAKNDAGLKTGDVGFLINGHVPDFFKFNPAAAIAPTDNTFRENPARRDRSHVIAFVVDGSKVEIVSDSVRDKLKEIRRLANEQCIPIVVLLTKIDKLCALQSLSSVFSGRAVLNAVEKAAETFGIPTGSIFPIKNYESEVELVVEIDILLLMALQTLIRHSRCYFHEQMDRFNLQN